MFCRKESRSGLLWSGALLAFISSLSIVPATELQWESQPGYRSAALNVPTNGHTGFTLMPPAEIGVAFTNHLSDRSVARNRVLENGSGVALGDVDGDGWCDIYFCQLEGPNVLYRNLGNWRFEDITASAGVACPEQYSTGAVFADIDGDGDLDLLVNSVGGGTRAFLNDGKGHFTELTGSRLVRRFGSMSLALADVDGDGDLDLYVTNYRTDTYQDRPPGLKVEAKMVDGRVVVTPENRFIPIVPQGGGVQVVELGERDFLYINDGTGKFAPASWTSGSFVDEKGQPLTAPPLDWGLSVMMRDMNGDGAPDIYVCNDFLHSPDRIWINESSTRFRALSNKALRDVSLSAMAVDMADINRDGYDDLLVVDMLSRSHTNRQRQRPNMMKDLIHPPISDPEYRPEIPRNTLFLNRGDGTYAETAQLSGVAATEWSWGVIFLDVDLDGYEDVLVATGNNHDVQDADAIRQIASIREKESPEERLNHFPRLNTANLAFRNRGDITFEEMGAQWGFNLAAVSQGMALADLDHDGDLDVVLNNLNSGAAIYRNESAAPRVAVRMKGAGRNTQGIGAKIRVTGGAAREQTQEIICGGRYLSADDPMRTFAAGSATNQLRIEVTWRSGKKSVIEKAAPDHIYELDEAQAPADAQKPPSKPPVNPFFEDVSDLLNFTHTDAAFDDYTRQPLLPHRLSNLGPGVAWVDVNGDGWDDLVIGNGRGGPMTIYENNGNGGFKRIEKEVALQDQTGIIGWAKSSTNTSIVFAQSNYENSPGGKSVVRSLNMGETITTGSLAELDAAAGPVAMSDVDGDGVPDLFIGGRVLGGRYPEPAASRLFRNIGGKFTLDETNSAVFEKAGLVSGAIFTDLDGDGAAELVLACEWGPIRIFHNEKGHYRETTRELGFGSFRGWWNGVAAGDFDGDGRMDIVASNWGRNTKYQAAIKQPLRLYYGDFNGTGGVEPIEAYFAPDLNKIVPWRDYETAGKALPFIQLQAPTFRAYGEMSVQEILGSRWSEARELQADTLDSMIFLNRGDHFEGHALPGEAQLAPGFGLAVADFDGDGTEDLFMAQNFFGVEPETSRYDSGRGLCMRGDGKGNLIPVSGEGSGIRIYGEQRGCAVADYNGDGKVDLVVTQNNGPARLFRNNEGKPGLRVRVKGPEGNLNGVGTVIRLQTTAGLGPAREIHAGSGYWSQDSVVQILGFRHRVTGVWAKWPGGRESVTPLADILNTPEITITPPQ